MVCPYRKEITNSNPNFGERNTLQSLEEFPECQGDECPLFNAKLIPPCMRAIAERNRAYILIKAEENK